MKNVIVGYGEVGKGLHKVIKGDVHDPFKQMEARGEYQVLHVCIPYTKGFIKTVKEYQKKFVPELTIIHSTVPVGTSKKLGAVHSPIRGVHPDIDKGIRTFVKFFGGEQAKEASAIFSKLGIKTHCTPKSETTEALKLWDTTQYGIMILVNRAIHLWCKIRKVDFDVVYTLGNETYNEGYKKLKRPEVVRPYLKHTTGIIGGHCVRQNAHLFHPTLARLFDKSR